MSVTPRVWISQEEAEAVEADVARLTARMHLFKGRFIKKRGAWSIPLENVSLWRADPAPDKASPSSCSSTMSCASVSPPPPQSPVKETAEAWTQTSGDSTMKEKRYMIPPDFSDMMTEIWSAVEESN